MSEWNRGHNLHRKVISLWEFHSSLSAHLSTSRQDTDSASVICTRPHKNLVAGNMFFTHITLILAVIWTALGKRKRESSNKHCRKECRLQNSFQFFSQHSYIRPLPSIQIKEFWVFSLLIPSGCKEMEKKDTCRGWDKSLQKKFSVNMPPPSPTSYVTKQVDWRNSLQVHVWCGYS